MHESVGEPVQAEGCYSPEYFSSIRAQSRASARVVAPLVMQLLQPRSVVDVGCGTAAWAAAFKAAGVGEVLGIDGDYCTRAELEIAETEFQAADLTKPIEFGRRYDLAICLEVAEHLEPQYATPLIDSLTRLAPVVLFSAAIPFQGGEHHVNEQWPAYWIELFAERGYIVFDVLRQSLWTNKEVAWWYAQNMLLFVDRKAVNDSPKLTQLSATIGPDVPSLVHPGCWFQLAWKNRVLEAAIDLMHVTPPGARILLVDNAELGKLPSLGRALEPFTERDGIYNGPPVDSQAAIEELQRKLKAGATNIAFAWPALWWLEHYDEFAEYLRARMTTILMNERWIVFGR
jgi:SAM-dependent methyltransferase